MATIQLSGFYSGIDTGSIVEQITALNRVPVTELEYEKLELDEKSSAFGFVKSSLESLISKLEALDSEDAFRARAVTSSNTDLGTASVDTTAEAGSIKVEITQLATSSNLQNAGKATALPSAGTDTAVSVFGSDITGYFMVNNTKVTIDETTTLDDIATAIQADAGVNTAVYNSGTGKFEIDGVAGSLILGSSGDTSDFLSQAQLFNSNIDGSGDVTSSTGVGRLSTDTVLSSANFAGATVSTDGTITINGVDISYSASDSIGSVLSTINDSDAGVIATYDTYADKFVLTAKERGSVGISVSDTSGNLAEAMQIRTGSGGDSPALSLGNATQFKVNDGAVRESADGTLDEDELGVTGLTFTPSETGISTLTIGADVESVKTLINNFVEQYNSVQNMIESYIAIDTDDPDNSGILASDSSMSNLPMQLRSIVGSRFSESGTIQMLEDLGIVGNENDNTLTLSDESKLEDALENNLNDVIDMFTNSSTGLVEQLSTMAETYSSDLDGVFTIRQESISDQQRYIDREIELLESRIESERLYLEAQFAAMESYQAQAQQFSGYFSSE